MSCMVPFNSFSLPLSKLFYNRATHVPIFYHVFPTSKWLRRAFSFTFYLSKGMHMSSNTSMTNLSCYSKSQNIIWWRTKNYVITLSKISQYMFTFQWKEKQTPEQQFDRLALNSEKTYECKRLQVELSPPCFPSFTGPVSPRQLFHFSLLRFLWLNLIWVRFSLPSTPSSSSSKSRFSSSLYSSGSFSLWRVSCDET